MCTFSTTPTGGQQSNILTCLIDRHSKIVALDDKKLKAPTNTYSPVRMVHCGGTSIYFSMHGNADAFSWCQTNTLCIKNHWGFLDLGVVLIDLVRFDRNSTFHHFWKRRFGSRCQLNIERIFRDYFRILVFLSFEWWISVVIQYTPPFTDA